MECHLIDYAHTLVRSQSLCLAVPPVTQLVSFVSEILLLASIVPGFIRAPLHGIICNPDKFLSFGR